MHAKPSQPPDRLIGPKEFCDLLGISRRTLDRRVARPDFPQPLRIPGSHVFRWRQSDVLGWIAARPVREAPSPPDPKSRAAKSAAAARAAKAAKRRAERTDPAAPGEREPPTQAEPAAPKSAPLYVTRAEIIRELARRHGGTLRFDRERQTWAQLDGARWRWLSAERVLEIVRETSRDLAQAQGRRWSGMAGFLRSVEQLARADAAFAAAGDATEPQP